MTIDWLRQRCYSQSYVELLPEHIGLGGNTVARRTTDSSRLSEILKLYL